MSDRLAGKKIWVTGAGGALGRATSIRLAQEGAAIANCDIDQTSVDETTQAIVAAGGEAVSIVGDVTDEKDCARMLEQADTELGGLNVLFNNAGILLPDDTGPVETPLDSWNKTLAVNLTGVFLCCKYGVPKLEQSGGGSVINTASIAAQVGSAFPQVAYGASKGGVLAMTKEMAIQYARSNIRFNALCPGPVHTKLAEVFLAGEGRWEARQPFIPMGRLGKPKEIANMVVFLASDESSFVNGATMNVDGGITAAYVASDMEPKS